MNPENRKYIPTSRPIIDSSNARKHASAHVACCSMDQSNSQLLGVGLSDKCFRQNCTFPFGDRLPHVTHCSSGQAHLSQMASRSVEPFSYGSQMLCCTMHCPWEENSKNCSFALDFVNPQEKDRATSLGNLHAQNW